MAFLPWLRRLTSTRWKRRRGPTVARATGHDLDLIMAPPYTMTWDRERARADVERLVDMLKPNAMDAGSRDTFNNYINAAADQAVAELYVARDDRIAISDALIGMAAEQVARWKPAYDADIARASHAKTGLAVTFEKLTGVKAADFVPPSPRWPTDGPLTSSLGPVNLSDQILSDDGSEQTDDER